MKRGKFETGTQSVPSHKAQQESETLEQSILICIHDLVYLLAVVMVVLLLLFRIVIVSGGSMNQTLVEGDYLLLLNSVFSGEPERGDIIVASKDSFRGGEAIVKRVIATEGQTVDIDFNSGIVYVDGMALEEPYTNTSTTVREGMQFPLTVEEGCLFVMGDNRDVSKDSRSPEIGLIDRREVMGKAIVLLIPGKDTFTETRNFERIGVL